MAKFLLVLVVAIVAAAIVFGVFTLISDGSAGLQPAEPDGRAVPLPGSRPLAERDVAAVRFDTVARGYRMEQVDQALRRTAYDIGYKDELIGVLTAEVDALRAGRQDEADELAQARRAAGTGHDEGLQSPEFDAPELDDDGTPDADALAAAADESDTDSVAPEGTAVDTDAEAEIATDEADDTVPDGTDDSEVSAGAARPGADKR